MGGTYRAIEHTADLALAVEADTLEDLFRFAALGMFELIRGEAAGPESSRLPIWRGVAVEAPDREALLVAWLGELLYAHTAEGLFLAEIRYVEVGQGRAQGEVGFVPLGSGVVERELKGVTYHDLAVERGDGRWHVRIVFDV